jgi:hypothetical protein
VFVVTAEYSETYGGTITTMELASVNSSEIRPGHSYHWDLESAHPTEFNDDLEPIKFDTLKTWVGGKAHVEEDWTLNTPVA